MKAQLQIGNEMREGQFHTNGAVFYATFTSDCPNDEHELVVSFEKRLRSREQMLEHFKSIGGIILRDAE